MFEKEEDLKSFSNHNKEIFKNDLEPNITTITIIDNNIELKYKKSSNKKPKLKPLKEWQKHFHEIDFEVSKKECYSEIIFYFDQTWTNDDFNKMFDQSFTNNTKSVYFPYTFGKGYMNSRAIGDRGNPQYPIYIISKGRANTCITADHLIKMEVPFKIVIEKQEWEAYSANYDEDCLLELDMSFKNEYDTYLEDFDETKSKGSGPARNFVWWHSKNVMNSKWHWILDDNIMGFYFYYDGKRIKSVDGSIFASAEDFVNRYTNIGIAGMDYYKFVVPRDHLTPYISNTKIYSCLLINNDIPLRWAGRYNEDVDICIRALKAGYSTIQFEAFNADKLATQTMGGGNTEAFYAEEGTLPKSNMLAFNHPDITIVMWRFARWHHYVDYSIFNLYRDRTIKDTIIYMNEPKLLNPLDEFDQKIIEEIKSINFSTINKWNILEFVPEYRREKIINSLKLYRHLKDNEQILEILTRDRILDCDLTNVFWGISDESEDEKIVSKLLALQNEEGVLEYEVDWDTYLNFVEKSKRDLIVSEMIRNKYLRKKDAKFHKNKLKIFMLPQEEHLAKKDSKAYIMNEYIKDGNTYEIPDTILDKKARGEIKTEQNKFKKHINYAHTKQVKESDHSIFVVGDIDFNNEDFLINTLSEKFKNKTSFEVVNSVNYPIDLLSANYCLNAKITNKSYIPNIDRFGKSAYIEMYKDILNNVDEVFIFIEKEIDINLRYLISEIKKQNKKYYIFNSNIKLVRL